MVLLVSKHTLHQPLKGAWDCTNQTASGSIQRDQRVWKAVLGLSCSVTRTWLYPLAKSRVENQQAPERASRISSMQGRGKASFSRLAVKKVLVYTCVLTAILLPDQDNLGGVGATAFSDHISLQKLVDVSPCFLVLRGGKCLYLCGMGVLSSRWMSCKIRFEQPK